MKENDKTNKLTTNSEKEYIQFKIRKDILKNKKVFFGSIIILITLIASLFYFLNIDNIPKYDENGKPIYYELNSEIYNESDKYEGCFFKIKGKVFNVMGEKDGKNYLQMWLDPEEMNYSIMIAYNSKDEIKNDDYIICTGEMLENVDFENSFGTKMNTPLVLSTDLKKSSYMEVMAPALKSIEFDNIKEKQYGYTLEVNKIDFAEKETRLYITVINKGTASIDIFSDAIIIQGDKQYKSIDRWEADYDQIQTPISKGVIEQGILVFPKIKEDVFTLKIEAFSDNYNENLKDFEMKVNLNKENITKENTVEEKNNHITNPKNNKVTSTEQNEQTNHNDTNTHGNKNIIEDRNSLAINTGKRVIKNEVKNSGYATKTWFLEHMQNVEGFTYEETLYAMNNCDVNWSKYAKSRAEDYMNNGSFNTPNDLKTSLEEDGYNSSEISSAISNFDWNNIAVNYVNQIHNRGNNKEYMINMLVNEGYTHAQAQYGVDNSNVDWSLPDNQ